MNKESLLSRSLKKSGAGLESACLGGSSPRAARLSGPGPGEGGAAPRKLPRGEPLNFRPRAHAGAEASVRSRRPRGGCSASSAAGRLQAHVRAGSAGAPGRPGPAPRLGTSAPPRPRACVRTCLRTCLRTCCVRAAPPRPRAGACPRGPGRRAARLQPIARSRSLAERRSAGQARPLIGRRRNSWSRGPMDWRAGAAGGRAGAGGRSRPVIPPWPPRSR